MHEAETNRLDDVKNVRMLMKRSSSLRENPESAILKEKYTWGCHSEEVQILVSNMYIPPNTYFHHSHSISCQFSFKLLCVLICRDRLCTMKENGHVIIT